MSLPPVDRFVKGTAWFVPGIINFFTKLPLREMCFTANPFTTARMLTLNSTVVRVAGKVAGLINLSLASEDFQLPRGSVRDGDR